MRPFFPKFTTDATRSKRAIINLQQLQSTFKPIQLEQSKPRKYTKMDAVATPLRIGGARWAARDHPTRGAFLLQLRVPVLELWLSLLQHRNTDPLHPAVQNLTHPHFTYVRTSVMAFAIQH
jgi:hypothetical protein